ncbi:TetR/AcrR family transcriptional regulator [Nocardia sp. NPDC088792]|uniref:TetR/AcrR family transcriptional regulator n=1 Tax=Nocardia sp. NPDC088792 TaxID=3364332 RepID=UPI003814F556
MDQQQSGADANRAVPIWARSAPRRRPAVTRDEIVTAAMDIAGEEGSDAVSMRRVAARLGIGPMALYTHIDSKDDLIDLIADELAGEIILDENEFSEDWRESISRVARRERAMIKRHPWATELVGKRGALGPNALLHIEQSYKALDGLDVPIPIASQIINAVDQYTTGFVLRESHAATRRDLGPDSPGAAYVREAATAAGHERFVQLLQQDPADFPDADESFEIGLGWLLEGITRDLGRG